MRDVSPRLPFAPRMSPYRDFVVIVTPRRRPWRRGRDGAAQLVLPAGAEVDSFADRRVDVQLWSWNGPSAAVEDGRGKAVLSGYAFHDGALLGSDPRDAGCLAGSEAARGVRARGCYSFVSVWDDAGTVRAVAGTDAFGLAQLFRADVRGSMILANRYHLIAEVMRQLGGAARLDPAAFGTSLFVDAVFATQSTTHRMPIHGIEMLGPSTLVRLAGGRVRCETPATPGGGDRAGYRDLIEAGADEIRDNLRAVFNRVGSGRVVLNLTGGRDSRTILAAVRSLGRSDAVVVETRRSGDDNDFETALHLAAHAGLRYRDEPMGMVEPVPPSALLAAWRSEHLGLYHELGISTTQLTSGKDDWIRLIGGCGELYRGYFQKAVPRAVLDAPEPRATAGFERHLDSLGLWTVLEGLPRRDVIALVISELRALPATTLSERLDAWYLHFRNRFHFGANASMSARFAPLAVSPLIAPALVAAARMLPAPQREAGQVIHDVIHELDPTLTYLPFESGGWDEPVTTATSGLRHAEFHGDVDAVRVAWERSRIQPTRGTFPSHAEWYRDAGALVTDSQRVIADASPALRFACSPAFNARLDSIRTGNETAYRRWVSRLAAIADNHELLT